MLSWPLLIINSSALYDHHTLIDWRAHAYKCQITTASVHHLPPLINMIFPSFHHTLVDGQLVVRNELTVPEKDNTQSLYFSFLPLFFSIFPSLFSPFTISKISSFLISSSFLYLCHVCIHSFIQYIVISMTWPSSPLTPCSGAQGSHHRRCPQNTPLFPHL